MHLNLLRIKNVMNAMLIGIVTSSMMLVSTPTIACTGGSNAGTITMNGGWQTQGATNGQYYEFVTNSGGVYTFTFCSNGGSAGWDTQISILDNSGTQVAYNDDYCGLQSQLTWTAPSAGTYRVLISEYFCNNAGGYTGTFAYNGPTPCPSAATYTPIIANDTVAAACQTDSVQITANGNYSAWTWSNGGTDSSTYVSTGGYQTVLAEDGSGCVYADTVFVSLIQTNMFPTDTTICQGESVELNATYDPDPCVTMNEFLESNSSVTDHNSVTGDDRGGIAVTPDYVYYTGDSYTGRFNASNLSGGTSLQRRDGLFSDLMTGDLYTLWDTLTDTFNVNWPTYSYNSINAFRMMDADLNTTTTLPLSQTINMGSSSFIAAGSGYVILWANNNDTFYHVDLSTGNVTVLGTGNLQTSSSTGIYMYGSENWAEWGIAECYNGGYAVVGRAYYIGGVYQYSPGQIGRWDIANSEGMQVSEFSGSVSDMACVTYSPWHQRWYFHYEGSGIFGGSSETIGYADATTGASSPFSFGWSNGDSGQVIEVSPDTTTMYIVEVTDGSQSCYDTATVTVTISPDISFTTDDIACRGDSNGGVTASLTGGTSPFNYNWTPLDTNVSLGTPTATNITGIPAGYYILEVVDDNGCSDMDTAFVWQPTSTFSPILSGQQDPLCSYSEDGEAIVLPAGGDAPYTYDWSNGVTTVNNVTLGSGSFSVTTTDANGCERILSGGLTAPDPVTMDFTATGNNCQQDEDGTATVTASGGTAPYDYEWENGDDDPNANGLESGFQTVTITDANFCMFVDSVEITFDNAAPVVPLPDSVEKCSENMITLDAGSDGVSYAWSTGDTTQTTTTNAGGLIFVTVTGENGCETEESIFVVNNPCPTGIADVDGASLFNVYPNPSNGVFNIEALGNLDRAIDLQVLDVTGRVMVAQSGALNSGSNITTLDLEGLARGTYMLRMLSQGELITVQQIVIQ